MKKGIFALLIAAAVAVPTLFAEAGPGGLTGLGVYGSFGSTAGALSGGLGLSLKWGSFPVVGLQYNVAGGKFNASIDYYVIDAEGFAKNLSYFLGAGAYAGVGANKFDVGLRILGGIQFWPIKKVELYLSPVVPIALYPTVSPGIGVELGGRLHF
jgi:hypothetical protein